MNTRLHVAVVGLGTVSCFNEDLPLVNFTSFHLKAKQKVDILALPSPDLQIHRPTGRNREVLQNAKTYPCISNLRARRQNSLHSRSIKITFFSTLTHKGMTLTVLTAA